MTEAETRMPVPASFLPRVRQWERGFRRHVYGLPLPLGISRLPVESNITSGTSDAPAYYISSAATTPSPHSLAEAARLERSVIDLIRIGREAHLQDGVYSSFTRRLREVLLRDGDSFLVALARRVSTGEGNLDVLAESLQQLGTLTNDIPVYSRWVFREGLRSPYATIRDGALMGLAQLNDPAVIGDIQEALAAERVGSLRDDMICLLQHLGE